MTRLLPFKCFVEQNLGRNGVALIYGILEFVMVVLLLLDGMLAFFSAEFAKFFELEIPCFLCTKIIIIQDHTKTKNSTFFCNGWVCEGHKKDISSLAYCQAHKILSDFRNMCEACLVSFSTHNHNNDNRDFDFEEVVVIQRCSCCGECLKPPPNFTTTASSIMKAAAVAPPSSPRDPELDNYPLDDHIHYTHLNFISDNDSSHLIPDNHLGDVSNGGGESSKSTSMPESGEPPLVEDGCRSPSFSRGGNKFLGVALSDSVQASPRWFNSKSRKMSMDFLSDLNLTDTNSNEGGDGDLKKQDRRSLMALYMELDEERSASAVAANNAMAMITRLQAEKAAVQMEALQHQRMMEEHAEYYREELQVMKELLVKREDEVKVLESELEVYREKFGTMSRVGSEICEVDANEDYQGRRSSSDQCIDFSELMSDFGKPDETEEADNNNDNDDADAAVVVQVPHHNHNHSHSGEYTNENMEEEDEDSSLEKERCRLLNMLSSFEKKCGNNASSDEGFLPVKLEEEEDQQDVGNENKVILTREMSDIRERLRAIEAESGFIKHATMTLQRGDEGIKLLTEIADNLKKLRAL